MIHFKRVCKHGQVLGQCRCPSPTKHTTVVACDHPDWYPVHPLLTEAEVPQPEPTPNPDILHFLDWLLLMDDPNSVQGMENRRVVTLTEIINRARELRKAITHDDPS